MKNFEAGTLLVKLYVEWSHLEHDTNSYYEEAIVKAIAALLKDGEKA